jgi:hypothetical protein
MVRWVHTPPERRSHSHHAGNPKSPSNIFADMKNNKAAFNLANRCCLYVRPTWIGGRCPTIPLLRHAILAVVLVKIFPLARRQNTELACIPLWSDYDNRWYVCVQPSLCGILNYYRLQTCGGNGKGFPCRYHEGMAVWGYSYAHF